MPRMALSLFTEHMLMLLQRDSYSNSGTLLSGMFGCAVPDN